METINNVATVAAKAVWGSPEANKEPVSGVQGDVAKGEPYDAGNLDPEEQKKVESRLGGDGAADGAVTKKKDQSSTATDDTTTVQNSTANPDDDEPKVDVNSPGPRPLAEVAREHGGDAGRDHAEPAQQKKPEESPADQSKDTAEGAQSSGTGEQHVHATGLAADGGDFDATKPGAGLEAERLLDQKGIEHGAKPPSNDAAASAGETNGTPDSKNRSSKPRRSLGERIKAKFHKK